MMVRLRQEVQHRLKFNACLPCSPSKLLLDLASLSLDGLVLGFIEEQRLVNARVASELGREGTKADMGNFEEGYLGLPIRFSGTIAENSRHF